MANLYDPNAEQPQTAQAKLIAALQGGAPGATAVDPGMAVAPKIGGIEADAPAAAAAPVAAAAPAPDFSRVMGYDAGKFNANKQDAKYQMGRTLAGFDPTQGITPDVLAALNGLGYGQFSGSGDKLNLSGLTDVGRKNGLTGDYSGADFIGGFKGGNGKWGYADPAAEAAQGGAAPAGGAAPSMAGGLSSLLQGNAGSNIQQALGQFGGTANDSSFLQKLIAQLQGAQ